MPWPLSYTPLWMVLLSLVVFDCVRSQRRINARQGEIRLLMDGRLRWQGQEWSIVKAPWMIKSGMMLRLRSEGGKRQQLWLAADSMDEAEWRDLRRVLLQQETQRKRARQTISAKPSVTTGVMPCQFVHGFARNNSEYARP